MEKCVHGVVFDMSKFMPNEEHSRTALICCFHLMKNFWWVIPIISKSLWWTCSIVRYMWTVVSTVVTSAQDEKEDKKHGKPTKKFEDVEDDSQIQKQLAEQLGVSLWAVSNRPREMGKIQNTDRWVPLELNTSKWKRAKTNSYFGLLVQKEIVFVSWIYFDNPRHKKLLVDPGTPSTSTVRLNRFGRKTMLCVCWNQRDAVYYELLKPGETVNTKCCQ